MPKQAGIFKITGTMDDVSFFKTDLVNSSRGQLPESEQASAPQMMRIVERMLGMTANTVDIYIDAIEPA